MRRLVTTGAVVVALVVIGLVLSSCGGDDEETTTSPSPAGAPSQGAPSDPGSLPPEFFECMADQGFEVESPDDIHSPDAQQAAQACFGSLHGGGV